MQAVTDPAGADAIDRSDAGHVLGGVVQLGRDVRVHAVEEARETAFADCQTMPKIIAVMTSPTIGSATGKPSHTPSAPSTTARLVSPSTRAW